MKLIVYYERSKKDVILPIIDQYYTIINTLPADELSRRIALVRKVISTKGVMTENRLDKQFISRLMNRIRNGKTEQKTEQKKSFLSFIR